MKYYKMTILSLAGSLLLAGCAQKAADQGPSPTAEQPTPAPAEETMATADTSMADDMTPADDAVTEGDMAVDEPDATETDEVLVPSNGDADAEMSAEDARDSESAPPMSMVIPRSEYQDIEQLPPGALPRDSVAYTYMIRPNDYLTKIAFNEYGNPNEWSKIYEWNRTSIGDDPNLIYPFRDLELYKPAAQVTETDFGYVTHTVASGENLWFIAGTEYKDERAWIVIFWDNEELLTENKGILQPGMELRIRTTLW